MNSALKVKRETLPSFPDTEKEKKPEEAKRLLQPAVTYNVY